MLPGREFAFPGEAAAAVSEAEAALVRLDERADAIASGGPARLLLRAEDGRVLAAKWRWPRGPSFCAMSRLPSRRTSLPLRV